MKTIQTRQEILSPGSRSRLPVLFCRSTANGQLLWSRGDGIAHSRPVDASVSFSDSCGSFSIEKGTTAENLYSREFAFLHANGSHVVAVTQSSEDRGDLSSLVPIVTSWEHSGGLSFALLQRDFPYGTEVINAAARSGIVWIQTIHNTGGELLAIDVAGGLQSRPTGFGILGSEDLGPMVRSDGSIYVGSGSQFGVMRPNGQLLWSRSYLPNLREPAYFLYPNGDLLLWNREFYDGRLIRFNGSTGAIMATSEHADERYSFIGDGRPGPDGSGGGFFILPDGRIGFNSMYTGEVYGYQDGDQFVVYPEPTMTIGEVPPGALPLWQVISGILDNDLRITEWREDRSAVGGADDSIIGYLKGNVNGLTWNDQFGTFVGLWRSEVEIPDDISVPWPLVPGSNIDKRTRIKGEPSQPAVRDAAGNWYSPELEQGNARIKSITANGVDRWSIDLGWNADLQFGARSISISGDGTRLFYLM
ncbi:hypothetical protein [Rubinisphaera italica]|uniref:Uncharacterized protein n=1 Tax=Rubinisphaera italica TaxID=2527969 RepID=A0A5C5XL84_9PLAN|nr:hypothetical protein [Rubinisphaera italica]TWT63201.1 hypothetical protein Pan54_39540 [Rubinisphaera italica]